MSNKSKLSREILGLFGATAAIAVFLFFFLSMTADSIVVSYCDRNDILFTEMQQWTVDSWIRSISFGASVILFVVLFLFLVGQKISYIKEITHGIEALRTHRMDYEMPLEGNNELTELAESINYLAKTERELQQKETELYRALSHDIRTPLTSILSYSEYLQMKETWTDEEVKNYLTLMQQKALQIKVLTERLLDGNRRNLETIENGKLLMEQLAYEWEAELEEQFVCHIYMEDCPEFSGVFDIQELRRIFDNLASNVKKYADRESKVQLNIFAKENTLVLEQKNACRQAADSVESYKIGLESMRKIAEQYDGTVEVLHSEQEYRIRIIFRIL